MAYDDDNIGDCASSRSDVESLYNHMVDRKVALEKKLRTTSQKLDAVQIKINQFRSKVEVNNIELEEMKEKFFDHKKLGSNKYFDPIKKLVLSANHKRKMHLTVLKKKDGSYCIKFLPIIGVIQTLDVGILKFAVIDLKSDSKRPVYFKKYIKYGINIRDTKKFTLEQLKQFTEMAYKAYVDWLKPIIETDGYRMVIGYRDKKSGKFKSLENEEGTNEEGKNDEVNIMKVPEKPKKYIVKSRL